MTSVDTFPIVVIAQSEAVYVAIAELLEARATVHVDKLLVERGELVWEGCHFVVYVVGPEHAEHAMSIAPRLPGSPHVVVSIGAESAPEVGGRFFYGLSIEAAPESELRWLGPVFRDQVRLRFRRGVHSSYGLLVTGEKLWIEIVPETKLTPVGDIVGLNWVVRCDNSASVPECARIAFRATLGTLADTTTPRPAAPSTAGVRLATPAVTGYLSRVAVQQVKCLAALDWDLRAAPGFYVVLGQNASGKTGLFRAITAALLPPEEVGALRADWRQWVRQGQTEATCTLSFADEATTGWRIADGTIEKTGHGWTGFSAAYGPFRRFTGGDVEYVREFASRRTLLRHLSLFSERVALSDALKWLQDLEFRKSKGMPTVRDELVAFVNETGLLPEGVSLKDIDPDGVWFQDANGARLPADELSDGFRAILSLALDLLRHLVAESAGVSLFAQDGATRVVTTQGVVIIDEIDAHLHATWQQRIGHWFKLHFPRFQFLVATHSAIVCQAADSVLLLPDPGTHDAPRMLSETELARVRYGDLLDAFDTGAFGEGVTRSEDSRRKLERLAELNITELQRPLTEAERDELRALRHIMPSSAFGTHPAAA